MHPAKCQKKSGANYTTNYLLRDGQQKERLKKKNRMNFTHEILQQMGYKVNADGSYSRTETFSPRQFWSEVDIKTLTDYYLNTPENLFNISDLSKKLNRTEASIHCKASDLKLTLPRGVRKRSDNCKKEMSEIRKGIYVDHLKKANEDRKGKPGANKGKKIWSSEQKQDISDRSKEYLQKHCHPRGMLGKKHSEESKIAMSIARKGREKPPEATLKMMQTKVSKYGMLAPNVKRGSWKAQWCEVGGKRFYARSSWEINHANWLESLKKNKSIIDWEHEPETFWFTGIKRGAMSYLPDFKITLNDNSVEFHEIKGWMDSRSRTKIKRFRKQFKDHTLKIFGKSKDELIQFKIPGCYMINEYCKLNELEIKEL